MYSFWDMIVGPSLIIKHDHLKEHVVFIETLECGCYIEKFWLIEYLNLWCTYHVIWDGLEVFKTFLFIYHFYDIYKSF